MILDGYTCTVYCAHPDHGENLPTDNRSEEWRLKEECWGLHVAASTRTKALAFLRKKGWKVVTKDRVQDVVCPQCVRLRPTWRKDLRATNSDT